MFDKKIKITILVIVILIEGATFTNAANVIYSSNEVGSFQKVIDLSEYGLANCTNPASSIYDPAVLKAYGKVPAIQNASQLNEFASKLRMIRESSWEEVDFYPNGSVVQYGSDPARGYFFIELYDSGETVYFETDIKEIYNILDKHAIELGIQDIPVVFTLTKQTDLIGFMENPDLVYDLDNKSMEEINTNQVQSRDITEVEKLNKSSANGQVPAIGTGGSLIVLFTISMILNRKM